jgi:CRP-like cAMP-binding protein
MNIIVCTYCFGYLSSVYLDPLNHFMKEILEYLSKNYWELSETAMTYIVKKSDEIEVKKKEILLEQGEVCRYVWFIKKGMLRSYEMNEKGKYFSNWFMKENDIATSVISFFQEEKTEEVIEVVEDSHLCRMSRKDLFDGLAKYRSLAMLTLKIMIKYYCQSRLFESILRRKEPEQIHRYLLQQHTELVQRVPEKHLATFLGITEPTYNSIKKGQKAEADVKLKKKKGK